MVQSIEELEASKYLLFKTLVGSRAYHLHNEQSDFDHKGIFIHPKNQYLKLREPAKQISDELTDNVYYSLTRFVELTAQGNPNIIELLFMPDDCIKAQSPILQKLFDQRSLFITKNCFDSHFQYASSQIKKARGRNKWVNNSKPVEAPKIEDFCAIITEHKGYPSRRVKLTESQIKLEEYHCSSVEGVPNLYRLYHYGESAKGVISQSCQVICRSIPKEDELNRFVALLHVNMQEYERALKDHKNYWKWKRNRNEARWLQQEKGELDYDAKNMMHTFRLLYSCENILTDRAPLIRFEGEKRQKLIDIRAGLFSYDELLTEAEKLMDKINDLVQSSPIPEEINEEQINLLIEEIYQDWEKENG